ncbi:MAG: hypothetical protein U0S36_11355 [Candidatus Nanopelagicales bacterium]
MASWYQSYFIDTGRSAALWVVIGFLVTYGITRRITLKIRARSLTPPDQPIPEEEKAGGIIKDIHIGGVHVHHQVWGILLVLVTGLLAFRYQPGSPWAEILGALFGAGAALALDEFALWLHVEDVYWSEEGRKSIDAVMIAVVVGVGLLLTTSPLGLQETTAQDEGLWFATVVVVLHIGYTIICMLKGKIFTGLIGLAVPIVSLVGAIRLAKPESFWARRFYKDAKLERARRRFADDEARRQKWRDRFGAGESLRIKAADVDAEAGGAQPVGQDRTDP